MENQPSTLIIFGIGGDLAGKKILPALLFLFNKKLLPNKFKIIGASRRQWHSQQLRGYVGKITKSKNKKFLNLFEFQSVDLKNPNSMGLIKTKLKELDLKLGTCTNKLFYFSTPPAIFLSGIKNMAKAKLGKNCNQVRISLEKPYGTSLKEFKQIEQQLQKTFSEKQIFRIDHYLGKNILQNILAFRFSNQIWEPNFNDQSIEKIEIKLLEKKGLETRGSFYDQIGALRDIGQSHILQMLALATMNQPKDYNQKELRAARQQLFKNLKPMDLKTIKANTQRGQFKDYQQIPGVKPGSKTETYFKIKTKINSSRWQNTEIILEGGKKMKENKKEICLYFKHPKKCLCNCQRNAANKIRFILEPKQKQGIEIDLLVKKPQSGWQVEAKTIRLNMTDNNALPEYAQLILDIIAGDQTLFVSSQESNAMWQFIDPIITAWQKNLVPLKIY